MSRFALRRNFLLASMAFLASLSLSGQYSERVEISIANVDVHVTDANGSLVRGLTKDDFEVYENGRLQTITNFSAIEAAASEADESERAAVQNAEPSPELQSRLIVLFIDIGDIEPHRRKQFFDGVRSFLHSAIREGDLLTILTWNHRVRVALPPTSDLQHVDGLIDIFAAPHGLRDQEMTRQVAEMQIDRAERDVEIARSIGMGAESEASATRDFQEWQEGEERCASIRRKAREIRNVIASLSRVDMQRVMILASDDFSLAPISRRSDPAKLRRECQTRPDFEALADTANAYGVTIHTFHPPGVRDGAFGSNRSGVPAPMAMEYVRLFDERGGLLLLAQRTGGLSGAGATHSAGMLEQVARQLDAYYSIGYRMEPGREDKPRNLEVRTRNRKYRVRARETVVFLSEPRRMRDLVTTSLYLPERTGPQTPAFEVKTGTIKRDGRFLLVPVEISIRAHDLVVMPSPRGKSKGSFSIFVAGGKELGDASEVAELKQDFERAANGEDETPVTYSFTSRIRPDTRRLSIAVRDNVSGEVASTLVALAP